VQINQWHIFIRDVNRVPGTRVQKNPETGKFTGYYPNLFPKHQPNRHSLLVSIALSTRRTLVLATPIGISCEAYP